MREIVPAVVSVLIATKASLKENFSSFLSLGRQFYGLLLSRYVLYASVVCILYKASKVELLNKHPNVGPMCFSWLASHGFFFFLIFVYRTQCIIPPPNACTHPEEPASASNAFCLADCNSFLTWELFLFSVARWYIQLCYWYMCITTEGLIENLHGTVNLSIDFW